MIFNISQKLPTYGISVPFSSVQITARVAPRCTIRAGALVYYGLVNFGDNVVPNYVNAIYPTNYTGASYDRMHRTAGVAAEAADTSGQAYPQTFIECFLPDDGSYEDFSDNSEET